MPTAKTLVSRESNSTDSSRKGKTGATKQSVSESHISNGSAAKLQQQSQKQRVPMQTRRMTKEKQQSPTEEEDEDDYEEEEDVEEYDSAEEEDEDEDEQSGEGEEEEEEEDDGEEENGPVSSSRVPTTNHSHSSSNSVQSESKLEMAIKESEVAFAQIEIDFAQIDAMADAYEEAKKSELFDEQELKEFETSLKFHYGHRNNKHLGTVQHATHKVQQAKQLWMSKKTMMEKMWKDGLLDPGVIQNWKQSIDQDEIRISDIADKLERMYRFVQ